MGLRSRCIGVVDGGMLILEDGSSVTLADVRAPRVGVPGGSVLRTVLQRQAQDAEVVCEVVGRDVQGYRVVTATCGGVDLGQLVRDAIADYGYAV